MNWIFKLLLFAHSLLCINAFFFPMPNMIRCLYDECCNDYYVSPDFRLLNNELRNRLYGQEMVINRLIPAVKSHFYGFPKKALVICMHGWTGGGKTYTTKILIDSLYKNQGKSAFVHVFSGRLHFPLESKVQQYQQDIVNWIKGNITLCPRSIFVFDEADKIPRGVIDVIKPLLDYHDLIEKINFREAIYIFISNIGGNLITQRYLDLWQQGTSREEMQYKDFEIILRNELYKRDGAFKESAIIESHLVTLFLPYLPLEKEHIMLCIKDEIRRQRIGFVSDEEKTNILNEMEYWNDRFSTSGCKRVHDKVAVLRYRNFDEL